MTVFPQRTFGVLLHPSSLFGREPIGTLGAQAHQFVDWLASTGAGVWQILPLTMNGAYDSPYFSYSAFAGNPWLVDLADLRASGLLDEPGLAAELGDAAVPFDTLGATKLPLLRQAARALLDDPDHEWRPGFAEFAQAHGWLDDTCHFFALKDRYEDKPWFEWPVGIARRDPAPLAASRAELAEQIEEWSAIFYFVDRQWAAVMAAAHAAGLTVLGDLPIYVSHDSADVWLDQQEFTLDESGHLTVQSGVPPDYFSETGQLWGNPLYRWDLMKGNGYRWWLDRLRRCLELSDVVRIDHFRALSAYWEVPADAADARSGRWVPGPGQDFIDAVREAFPSMPFVAEDLGTLDDEVLALRDENDLPGMRILQFGFDGTPDNPHQPHQFSSSCLAYTGTHDNDTVAGWWATLDEHERAEIAAYYQVDPGADVGRVVWAFIEATMGSRADVAVIPIQDLLVLDSRARMNDPSVFVGNWSWRMPPDGLSPELAASLRGLAERYDRLAPG
ncbi:MAG: 4-alpha-glucanotransferase [Jiangellales bacterium]